ncbi:MAG: SDR family NAD(P)-dependent oxidoreductase [Xanthomonadales bacterium]|nr:SDR family NAD(P)-dependent oxidoreductase [Xanthomonadales bacterium]
MKISGKQIVITGGTSGIGLEIVKQLYSNNTLIVISKNNRSLDALAEKFDGIVTYQANLSFLSEAEAVANSIAGRFDSIDILINNAASQYTPMFLDDGFFYESISKEITLNFTSICCLIYLLLPSLIHRSPAVILNINSGLGLVPKTSSAIYCGTKGALNLFSQSLRYQLEDTNVGVQQAFLPLVDTAMTKGRGKNKLTATAAASKIIRGMEQGVAENDIGKVKLLRALLRMSPSLARRILKNS